VPARVILSTANEPTPEAYSPMPPAKRTLIVAAVLLTAAVAVLAVTSYHEIAIHLAPGKRAVTVRAAAALSADSLFWRTFHSGDFDGIPRAAEALTAAYLTTPTDPVTAAHLAWLHNWRMAERARRDSVRSTPPTPEPSASWPVTAWPRATCTMTSGSRVGPTSQCSTPSTLTREYATWKFRPVLEDRIAHARVNVARFNAKGPDRDGLMINSAFSCMACHQE
jgi:hypothetical protein